MNRYLLALSEFLFGYSTAGKTPERIATAIRKQQAASERLITICQLLIVLTFITLYFLAPKPADQGMFDSITIKVIGAYLVFSLLRLYLCEKGFIPGWFLALSVLADIALLMLLIWGFHIEYQQPPGFYLKAPTLLYVFIFIALRALRFDTVYLLLTGVGAAVGWAFLVQYAIAHDETGTAITRSYVEYITSSKILRGAEFDKIISILVTTGIIAIAITRAKRLMIFAVRESMAATELKRFFAPEVAATISESETSLRPGQGVIRDAAILNVDIRGFTAMAAAKSPDEVMLLLSEYQSRVVRTINARGGRIDKFLGDGILASFGVNSPDHQCARNALLTISDIRAIIDTWNTERRSMGNEPISLGVSVTVGPVIFGVVGSENRLEYTMIGDAVNLCAKLEKHCKTEACFGLATRQALDAAIEQGYKAQSGVEIRKGRRVDGVAEPVDLAIIEP